MIATLWEMNRQINNLIDYQDRKQILGEELVAAHKAFNSILDRAMYAHDRFIREEETKASTLLEVKEAMQALEMLFYQAREFYLTEPTRDASAAVCFMFGAQANSLQDILDQTASRDPKLMPNVQPNIAYIRDFPNLQHLMSLLIKESTRIHSIMNTHEDRNQERLLKERALERDLEALKHKINAPRARTEFCMTTWINCKN